jgi:AcrR family transcriptional regulator
MGVVQAEKRRSQNRADARRVILDATEALLVEEGYERFSIRKLVARSGYSAPSIYHHFGDKKGLIQELLEGRSRQLVIQFEALPQIADPRERMRALSHAFVSFGLRDPDHYWLLTTPFGSDPSDPPRSAEEARAILEAPLDELAAAGQLNADIETVRQAIWALIHGLILLPNSRPEIEWADDLFEVAFDAMCRGLLQSESGPVGKSAAGRS